ncbi:phytoene/squalene synthase family protein [bacterium]|nr:phytoene/squalene synthase family protein [bacterium]
MHNLFNPSISDYVRQSGSSFYFPMLVFPKDKRDAIMTVYAFCRYTDDMVDTENDNHNPFEFLDHWKTELQTAISGKSQLSFLNRLVYIARRFSIPLDLFFELIRGVEMDLTKNRYKTFDELYEYCYRVASTVGLMTVSILGKKSSRIESYAVNTGIAVQLTNIIRDVASDVQKNRIYIPKQELEKFGCTEEDLLSGNNQSSFVMLMREQCIRARRYYMQADDDYAAERSYLLFPARAMQNIYYSLLVKTEQNLENLSSKKISLSIPQKASIVFKTWWNERQFA